MTRKIILAKILGLKPDKKIIEILLKDHEIEEVLKSLLDEIIDLHEKINQIAKQVKSHCKLNLAAWDPLIEKAILIETAGDKVAEERTRKRKKEILSMVKVSLKEEMSPSDIRAVIEVMVVGMQPGDAHYLPQKEGDIGQELAELEMKMNDENEDSSKDDFLKTLF
ncbi:MAG: hypothetical protein GY749_08320 [Desulfobacteraceae bacterium]|nr:hypothetical protein [Desulfobacteraceae bacterium]